MRHKATPSIEDQEHDARVRGTIRAMVVGAIGIITALVLLWPAEADSSPALSSGAVVRPALNSVGE